MQIESTNLACKHEVSFKHKPNVQIDKILLYKFHHSTYRNAPEVLQWGSFSTEGDVWSFGVVIWEFLRIWNSSPQEVKGDVLPYATKSDTEVQYYREFVEPY